MMDKIIKVCLRCYEAVIKLHRGTSESILKSKCEYCGRIFVLEREVANGRR